MQVSPVLHWASRLPGARGRERVQLQGVGRPVCVGAVAVLAVRVGRRGLLRGPGRALPHVQWGFNDAAGGRGGDQRRALGHVGRRGVPGAAQLRALRHAGRPEPRVDEPRGELD